MAAWLWTIDSKTSLSVTFFFRLEMLFLAAYSSLLIFVLWEGWLQFPADGKQGKSFDLCCRISLLNWLLFVTAVNHWCEIRQSIYYCKDRTRLPPPYQDKSFTPRTMYIWPLIWCLISSIITNLNIQKIDDTPPIKLWWDWIRNVDVFRVKVAYVPLSLKMNFNFGFFLSL